MKNPFIYIKIILSILLLICLFDMPYGYYQLVRFLGMIGFGVLGYNSLSKSNLWATVWFSSAILINPNFKLSLGREIWNIVYIIWSVILIFSIKKNN